MAKIGRPNLQFIGGRTPDQGIYATLSIDVQFSQKEKELDLTYHAHGFLFDQDGEADFLVPLIVRTQSLVEVGLFSPTGGLRASQRARLRDDPVTRADRSERAIRDADGTLIKSGTSWYVANVKPDLLGQTLEFPEIQIKKRDQDAPPDGVLVSEATLDAFDSGEGGELEIYAFVVLTNELGGMVVSESYRKPVPIRPHSFS